MSEMPDPESSADRIVASLHNVDEKVNALREQRINDPDDLCDKMFKVAAPTLAGLVFGKLFELAWRKSVGRKAVLPDGTTDKRKELALNLVRWYRNYPTADRRRWSIAATPVNRAESAETVESARLADKRKFRQIRKQSHSNFHISKRAIQICN